MALSLLAGAAIATGAVAAASPSTEVQEDVNQYQETRKKGIMMGVVRAQQAISGAPNNWAPFPGPRQDLKTLSEVQRSFAIDTSNTIEQQARDQLRPKNGTRRIPISSSGAGTYLMKILGDGATMGNIRGSEKLKSNPYVVQRPDSLSPWNYLPGGDNNNSSAWAGADDSSRYYTPEKTHLNTWSNIVARRNPYQAGGLVIDMNTLMSNNQQGRGIPKKGDLIPTTNGGGFKSKPIMM
jgi:hypothetical protein